MSADQTTAGEACPRCDNPRWAMPEGRRCIACAPVQQSTPETGPLEFHETTPSMPGLRRIGDRLYVTIHNVEHGLSDAEAEWLFLALWRELQPAEMLAMLKGGPNG